MQGFSSFLIITRLGCKVPQTRKEQRRETKVMKALVTWLYDVRHEGGSDDSDKIMNKVELEMTA